MEPRSAAAPAFALPGRSCTAEVELAAASSAFPASSSRRRPASSHENRGDMSSGLCRSATNRRSGSATGRLRSTMTFRSEKTAAAPPIPSASDETATVVNTGLRRRRRRPNRTSWKTSDSMGPMDRQTVQPVYPDVYRGIGAKCTGHVTLSGRFRTGPVRSRHGLSLRLFLERRGWISGCGPPTFRPGTLNRDCPRGQSRLSVPELSRSERGGGGGRICSR